MEAYEQVHRHRVNLWIHLFAVPLFALSFFAAVLFVASGAWLRVALCAAAIGLALGLQSFGHSKERIAPAPFEGPANFARRILVEQFVTFPRFFFGGGWWRAMRSSQ